MNADFLEICMFKPLLKLLSVATLLIAFIGQTMAFHFMASYGDFSDLQDKPQQQIVVSHSDDVNTTKDVDDCCDIECCENICICPANACASIVYLDSVLLLSAVVLLNESLLPMVIKDTYFIATSFYRPPISVS